MKAEDRPFQLYGIFGNPLGHTLSPALQEAAFRAIGLKAFYLPFELSPAEFGKVTRRMKNLLLDGVNITVPYKEKILSRLDRVERSARAIGAVNTLVRQGDRWTGFNTDWTGFVTSLEKEGRFRCRGKRALLLGAGGSARAVAYGLAKRSVKSITIANRTRSKAERIVKNFKKLFPKVEFQALSLRGGNDANGIDLVVNATSVGLGRGDRALVSPGNFPKKTLFVDLIYNPPRTRMLRLAARSGRRTLNGAGMLLYQGAEAFRLWTGKKAPLAAMKKALREGLHAH